MNLPIPPLTALVLLPFTALIGAEVASQPILAPEASGIEIRRFQPDQPVSRAKRPAPVMATVLNTDDRDVTVNASLSLPPGIRVLRTNTGRDIHLGSRDGEETLSWELEAEGPMTVRLQLELAAGGKIVARQSLDMNFLPPVEPRMLAYIPDPKPVSTEMLIGAHHCPLWESDKPNMWLNVLKHPERTPALGFYSQENPEVSDWETKWAVEHGISFFIYCWYRTSQGGAVKTQFGSAIHDALFKSKFVRQMKFTIMWENQSRGKAGVADERDLMGNLLPYWMDNYFKHPSYLKVDNKPVLFIYRPEFLADDLGGVTKVVRAFDQMRQACRDQGFDGLYLLGEYRGTDPHHLKLMKSLGLDYTFAYCWYVPDNPTPEQSIQAQMNYLRKTQALNILPQVVTVSQAWSGWADEGTIWKIPPPDFERLLRQAKAFAGTLPKQELGSRMLLLDNWNEWGEGHYIAPYREYGFGYLDAVRKVFASAPNEHEDLIPEDIGMGPYDRAVREHFERETRHQKLMTKKVVQPGAPEGLVAWWTFDEDANSPVALDYSGHRLGGVLHKATRAAGYQGKALVCQGGNVTVPGNPRLSLTNTLSIECRVYTDKSGQDNQWILNRVFGDNTTSGFRLGVLGGKPCFQVPLTAWSHHLQASEPLPTGRWVHLAATFDGKTMRIYLEGTERGSMDRPGEIKPNGFHLVLGNYEVDHAAHFTGLLDDVRLYSRALGPDEVRAHALAPPAAANASSNASTQYILFNRAPGQGMNQGIPESLGRKQFEEVLAQFPNVPASRVQTGLSYIFSPFRTPPETTLKALRNFLEAAEQTDTPVLVQIDTEHWWEARPDLWNWWDRSQPGFDPMNRLNVEWTGWSPDHAIKIAWRNWGSQIRVLPAPNLGSSRYTAACREEIRRLVPVVLDWHAKLPADKKHLLIGVKLGHETSIGVNAYHYPGGNDLLAKPVSADPKKPLKTDDVLARGMAQLGYAALFTSGIRAGGAPTESELRDVAQRYLEMLCREAAAAGVPRELLFTHGAGWKEGELSYDVPVNRYACPGWSFYAHAADPRQDAGVQRNLARSDAPYWAATEWLFQGPGETAAWRNALSNTLSDPRCRYVCIFNWEGIRSSQAVLASIREVVEKGVPSGNQPAP